MTLKDKYINPLTDFGFEKLFKIAEIAKFTPKEKEQYEESLKYYRDLKNVVDASKEEGIIEGKIEVAKNLKKQGISTEIINKATGLSKKEIDNL
jgi:predicted transposase/invertase (TIGR01784 family)